MAVVFFPVLVQRGKSGASGGALLLHRSLRGPERPPRLVLCLCCARSAAAARRTPSERNAKKQHCFATFWGEQVRFDGATLHCGSLLVK